MKWGFHFVQMSHVLLQQHLLQRCQFIQVSARNSLPRQVIVSQNGSIYPTNKWAEFICIQNFLLVGSIYETYQSYLTQLAGLSTERLLLTRREDIITYYSQKH